MLAKSAGNKIIKNVKTTAVKHMLYTFLIQSTKIFAKILHMWKIFITKKWMRQMIYLFIQIH